MKERLPYHPLGAQRRRPGPVAWILFEDPVTIEREAYMVSTRRFGGTTSQTRSLILDAAEQLMVESGHNSVTSRNLAKKSGLTHQAVFYYFPSMDDLFAAVLDRQTDEVIVQFNAMLTSERPLRALWKLTSNPESAKLELEFKALASHREPIRKAMVRQIETFRSLATEALAAGQTGAENSIVTPIALTMLVGCVGRYLVLEESLDISMGHAQARILADYLLDLIEEKGATAPQIPNR